MLKKAWEKFQKELEEESRANAAAGKPEPSKFWSGY
jgi:hypothetical protein